MRNRVAVVGAGVGGLVSALELARRGAEVTVVERSALPGGKLREQWVDGHRIDAGPTVFTMRSVFEEIFSQAGASLSDYLTLQPLQTLARHAWSREERLDLHAEPERSAEAIGEFAGPAEARRYLAFCEQARRVYQTLESPFLHASRPAPWTLAGRVGVRGLGDLLQIRPFTSLWRALGQQFRDPRLQQLFARYATYMGSSPFSAPATLMLIAHVERSGVWVVEGGMYRIVEALCRLAGECGVQFRYGASVSEVALRHGRVSGLVLSDGERLEVDAAVINADPAAVAGGHLGDAVRRAVPVAHRSQRSLSALTWTLVTRPEGFPLLRHTVFFNRDYSREFEDVFRRDRLPDAPTVYICAQDRTDRSPPTGEAERLLCLVNAPPTGDRRAFTPDEADQALQRAILLLQHCGLELGGGTGAGQVTTPDGFDRLFPATGGALYGRASHGWRATFRRPGSRTRVPGLYLAGGGTHPGAGVPMAALSGRLAAAALCQDQEMTP